MQEFKAAVNGKRWRVVLSPELRARYGCLGSCDAPTAKHKSIYLEPEQSDESLLDTLIHELRHAEYPEQSEDVVARRASELTRNILKLFNITRKELS